MKKTISLLFLLLLWLCTLGCTPSALPASPSVPDFGPDAPSPITLPSPDIPGGTVILPENDESLPPVLETTSLLDTEALTEPLIVPPDIKPADPVPAETEPAESEPAVLPDEPPADTLTIYLTFDDGPSAKNTARILDILAEKQVKATFFTVGYYVNRYPQLVLRMQEEGHLVGCHSYTHDIPAIYESPQTMANEIAKWETACCRALGALPAVKLFRYPGGSAFADEAILSHVEALGYRVFDWNATNNDCILRSRPEGMSEEDYLKESLISTVAYSMWLKNSPHIVLLHETYSQTADMLAWAIDYLQSLGCRFDTLDHYYESWYY